MVCNVELGRLEVYRLCGCNCLFVCGKGGDVVKRRKCVKWGRGWWRVGFWLWSFGLGEDEV